jgi:hypothetical protein
VASVAATPLSPPQSPIVHRGTVAVANRYGPAGLLPQQLKCVHRDGHQPQRGRVAAKRSDLACCTEGSEDRRATWQLADFIRRR